MAITVKHSKVSTIPDDADTSLVRPSDWNADHTLVGLGTMAEQNANAVAITGGTINGTTVGATTPAAGTFTTITGQTEVLKGTGTNLLRQSQSFTSGWTLFLGTFTTNTATDPLGTTTAATLTMSGASNAQFYQNFTATSGVTYTWSIYAKAGTTSSIQLACYATSEVYNVAVNLSTGTITGTTGTGTSTITSAGNGWYRITGTATATAAGTGYLQVNVIGNANTCFLWGGQLEVGTTANAFVATTTTAIYGTPTLSFSGVSEIGLLSNGALYLQPAGTGAIQAQATTSSATGGNARGANAVDWQMNRSSAGQVASNSYSSIGGGQNNTSSGYASTIAGGRTNTANIDYSVVSGGNANTASGQYSAIMGGYNNTAAGIYNFIGGGSTNSGTANGAVTTQSATMNATTAVTLSGSNASIKVGQYITGTSISTNTYVAAISGTSLTLSQNASGSSTSTLSFYTPHGVVVGGGNNQATGSYSFIGGGGDAGTAANRNVASGDWSFVGGGAKNTASGIGSFVGGGGTDGTNIAGNLASGVYSAIVGGYNHTASATGSFVGNGFNHTANGSYTAIINGTRGNTRSIVGYVAFPAVEPIATTSGCTQAGLLVLGVQTTDATATALRSNSSAASTTNQVILPNNSAYFFTGEVVSGKTAGGDTKGWTIEGVIKRGANAASTALVGTPTVVSTYADVGAATWAIAVTADTTNGGIRVTFTGQAATTIRTVCQIRTTEMTY